MNKLWSNYTKEQKHIIFKLQHDVGYGIMKTIEILEANNWNYEKALKYAKNDRE